MSKFLSKKREKIQFSPQNTKKKVLILVSKHKIERKILVSKVKTDTYREKNAQRYQIERKQSVILMNV